MTRKMYCCSLQAVLQTVAVQVLLYAQLRDNSNNMVKIVTGGLDKLPDEAQLEVTHQSSISAVINAHHTSGIVTMNEALKLAISKAKEHGAGIVGTNHTATGSGAIGWVYTHCITTIPSMLIDV